MKKKRASYDPAITMLSSAAAVTAGLRKIVFRPCAFTSLGAVSVDSIKFINGAAGLAKLRAELALRQHPRDDGLLPQQLSKRLRFQARAAIRGGHFAWQCPACGDSWLVSTTLRCSVLNCAAKSTQNVYRSFCTFIQPHDACNYFAVVRPL